MQTMENPWNLISMKIQVFHNKRKLVPIYTNELTIFNVKVGMAILSVLLLEGSKHSRLNG